MGLRQLVQFHGLGLWFSLGTHLIVLRRRTGGLGVQGGRGLIVREGVYEGSGGCHLLYLGSSLCSRE